MTARVRMLGGLAGVAIASRARPASSEAESAEQASWQQPREVMERFVDLLYRRRQIRAAFESCVAGAGFRDHDPSRPGGRQAAIELLARQLSDPRWTSEVLELLVDGDRAAVHLRAGLDGQWRHRVDLFRLAGGRIVEHWGYVAQDEGALPQAESRTTS